MPTARRGNVELVRGSICNVIYQMGRLPHVALPQRDIRRWRVRPNLLEEGETT